MKPHRLVILLAALLGLAAGTALATDNTKIRTQVIQTMQGMIAAEERLDSAAAWAIHAKVPGYCWVDIDGIAYDFAGTRKTWADFLAGCTKLKYTTLGEDVLVLAPDLAFYTWIGSADVTPKNGPHTRHEQWTARYLCRHIDGAWKIIGGQESAAPGEVVGATTAAQPAPRAKSMSSISGRKHDEAAFARAVSPTMVSHYNGTIIPAAPQDHLAVLRECGGARPAPLGRIDHFVAADGIGAAVTSWTGALQGDLAGNAATGGRPVAPTGRKLSWGGNYVFRIEAGKIVELWETWDEGGTDQKLLRPEIAGQ